MDALFQLHGGGVRAKSSPKQHSRNPPGPEVHLPRAVLDKKMVSCPAAFLLSPAFREDVRAASRELPGGDFQDSVRSPGGHPDLPLVKSTKNHSQVSPHLGQSRRSASGMESTGW